MPLRRDEVDTERPFEPAELLYRRVSPDGVNGNGEFLPSELNTISFNNEIDSAPSVLRSQFSEPKDVIATECADGNDVSSWRIFAVAVGDLPSSLVSGDSRSFDIFPVHRPLEFCGAHSVIASCPSSDPTRTYFPPPRSVKNALRAKLATLLRPIKIVNEMTTAP